MKPSTLHFRTTQQTLANPNRNRRTYPVWIKSETREAEGSNLASWLRMRFLTWVLGAPLRVNQIVRKLRHRAELAESLSRTSAKAKLYVVTQSLNRFFVKWKRDRCDTAGVSHGQEHPATVPVASDIFIHSGAPHPQYHACRDCEHNRLQRLEYTVHRRQFGRHLLVRRRRQQWWCQPWWRHWFRWSDDCQHWCYDVHDAPRGRRNDRKPAVIRG